MAAESGWWRSMAAAEWRRTWLRCASDGSLADGSSAYGRAAATSRRIATSAAAERHSPSAAACLNWRLQSCWQAEILG